MPRLPSQLTYNDLNGDEAVEILTDWFRQLLKTQPIMQPHLTLPMARFALNIGVDIDMYVGGSVPVAAAPDRLSISGSVVLDNGIAHEHLDLTTTINAAPVPGGQPPDKVRESHSLPVPRPGYGPRDTGQHMFLSDVLEGVPDSMHPKPHIRTGTLPMLHPDIPNTRTAPAPPSLHSAVDAPSAPSVAPDATGGRRGEVADGYVFSAEVVTAATQPLEQHIAVDNGEIQLDLKGDGIRHESGMLVKERAHRASVKDQGDEKGKPYSSVNGVYDAGPRGLMNKRGGGGLGTDGRPRISFGNSHGGG